MKRAYIVSILFLLVLLVFTGQAKGVSCESCHSPSSSNPSGGWVYHPPILSLVHDPFYSTNSEVTVRLIVTGASDYDISSLSASLSIANDKLSFVSGEEGIKGTNSRGEPYIEWALLTSDEGKTGLTADVEYDVYYRHATPGNKDEATYIDRVTTTIITADLDIQVSPGTMIFEEEGETGELILSASGSVTNIRIDIPGSLKDFIAIEMDRTELNEGENLSVIISVTNLTDIISSIGITWMEVEGEKTASVEIVITDPGSGGENVDIFWEVGKYTGIAAFILLVTEYFTGGTSFLKKTANKFFGSAKKRVDFHCAISFIILILVLIHFVVLFYGPFRELIFQWEVILGELALLIMVIVSLNGIFQRKLVKWMGFQNWRRVHAWGSGIIKVLVIVHMLLYGSHFLWFRNLIGYG